MLRGEISERDYCTRARGTGELVGERGWDMPMPQARAPDNPNSDAAGNRRAGIRGALQASVGILGNSWSCSTAAASSPACTSSRTWT
jgi:hypothetical protein